MPIIDGIHHGADIVLRGRREPKDKTEAAQVARLNAGIHLLSDDDLREIYSDWHAGVAREIASEELERRAGLSAHDRTAETAARARSAC